MPVWEWKQVCCLPPARRHQSFWVLPPRLCPRSNVSVPSLLPTELGHREKSAQEGSGGEKMGGWEDEAQVEGLCPLSGVSMAIFVRGSAGGTAWLGCACPLGSACCLAPALPPSADVGSRGCFALASAPAASEIKDTAAAVPALEISWLLGCGGAAGWNWSSWSSSACSGMSRSAAGDTGSHQNPGRRRGGGCSMAGRDRVWVGPPVLGNVAEKPEQHH